MSLLTTWAVPGQPTKDESMNWLLISLAFGGQVALFLTTKFFSRYYYFIVFNKYYSIVMIYFNHDILICSLNSYLPPSEGSARWPVILCPKLLTTLLPQMRFLDC